MSRGSLRRNILTPTTECREGPSRNVNPVKGMWDKGPNHTLLGRPDSLASRAVTWTSCPSGTSTRGRVLPEPCRSSHVLLPLAKDPVRARLVLGPSRFGPSHSTRCYLIVKTPSLSEGHNRQTRSSRSGVRQRGETCSTTEGRLEQKKTSYRKIAPFVVRTVSRVCKTG